MPPAAVSTFALLPARHEPHPSPEGRRACSASCAASDGDGDGIGHSPPQQRARQTSALIEPLLALPAVLSSPTSAANTRPAPPISPPLELTHGTEDEGTWCDVGAASCSHRQARVSNGPTPLRGCEGTLLSAGPDAKVTFAMLPNEVLLHVLGFLDVSDLLSTSRTSHQFRSLALAPTLHRLRLRRARTALSPLLMSPSRPTLADLMQRSIFLTNTTLVSRRLARSLTAIRLSRRLAARPEPQALVARLVLPPECVPPGSVAPALVAKRRAVEREQVRDGMRRWVGGVWERRWREKAEDRRRWEERSGVGRVWRLRRFWERVGRGDIQAG